MVLNVVVIEDDDGIREYLKEILTENEYSVRVATNGTKGLEIIERTQPDIVILDLKLPDINGEEICKRTKKLLPQTKVIILTAKDKSSDIAQGFGLGADDYVTKPFTSEELLARIKARLKNIDSESTLKLGDLVLDRKTVTVTRGGKEITVTPQEFALLEYLLSNKTRVLTREMILSKVWQYSPDIESRVVDVYVGYLRKKIDGNFKNKLIHTIRGFGYVMKEDKGEVKNTESQIGEVNTR